MKQNQQHHIVFYGWWIVAACFLISMYVSGTVHFGFTAFFEPIAKEFGWSYTQVSFAASLRGLEMGLFVPVVGLLVDRWGPRKLILTGAILSGLGLVLLSQITSLPMFYGVFALIGIGISACIGVAPMTAIANWFRRKMPIAVGVVLSGVALGGFLIPVLTRLIDVFQWRTVMAILGLGMWGIVLPLSLVVRHKPEQYGYLPDGVSSNTTVVSESQTSDTSEVSIPVKQAVRSGAFWHLALAFMGNFAVVTAVVTHVMPYLGSIGVGRSTSSLVAGAMPLFTIFGRLGLGWLGSMFDKRWLVAMCSVLIGLGMLSFGFATTMGIWLVVPFLVFFSIGYGGSATMTSVLVREYFGRSRFGIILGFVMGIMTIGQIIGPPLAGWVFDTWGSYQGAWFAFAGLALAAAVSLVTAPSVSETSQRADTLGA